MKKVSIYIFMNIDRRFGNQWRFSCGTAWIRHLQLYMMKNWIWHRYVWTEGQTDVRSEKNIQIYTRLSVNRATWLKTYVSQKKLYCLLKSHLISEHTLLLFFAWKPSIIKWLWVKHRSTRVKRHIQHQKRITNKRKFAEIYRLIMRPYFWMPTSKPSSLPAKFKYEGTGYSKFT